MPYKVNIRRKNPNGRPGKVFGTFGPFTTQKKAKQQAQILADQCAPGHVVTVEPTSNPRKKKRKRNTTSRGMPAAASISNPRGKKRRMHKGHSIVGTTGHYVVEAYDKAFRTLAAAKKWIDSHVKAEMRRLNPRVRRRPNAGWSRVVDVSPAGYRDVYYKKGKWTVSRVGRQGSYLLSSGMGATYREHGHFSTLKAAKKAAQG